MRVPALAIGTSALSERIVYQVAFVFLGRCLWLAASIPCLYCVQFFRLSDGQLSFELLCQVVSHRPPLSELSRLAERSAGAPRARILGSSAL